MLETLIRWAAYFGGWLLVAGPLMQSRLELEAERSELAGIREAMRLAPPPSRPSAWWWLLPPAAFVVARRAQHRHLATLSSVLTAEQFSALRRYFSVARGWMIVAAGATLIAIKETYELSHHLHWQPIGFWALFAVAAIAVSAGSGASSARSRAKSRRFDGAPAHR